MTEVVWLDCLLRAEEYDKQIIASKERITKKADKAVSSTSRADDTNNTKRHKKNPKPKSAKEKTAQGKARYCSMCKKAGMPEGKGKSHHTNNCTNQGYYEQKLSGNTKSNIDAKAQYKREIHKLQKATKLATSKLKKFAKAAKSAKSSKKLRKFQKSLSKGKKKRSKSSSAESDKSGQISESSSSSDSSDSSSASSYWSSKDSPILEGKSSKNNLDKIIDSTKNELRSMLLNEIDSNQLTSSGKTRHATPTTFVNIRKGKQGRHIEWMGLFLLFDSGASKSFVREKYVKH